MGISLESATEFGINQGLESHRPVDPLAGSIYLATDTDTLHICFDSGVWESQKIPVSNPLSVDSAGVLKFDGKPIIPRLADNVKAATSTADRITQLNGYNIVSNESGFITKIESTSSGGSGYANPKFAVTTKAGRVESSQGRQAGNTTIQMEITHPLAIEKGEMVHIQNISTNGQCFDSHTISLLANIGHLEVI